MPAQLHLCQIQHLNFLFHMVQAFLIMPVRELETSCLKCLSVSFMVWCVRECWAIFISQLWMTYKVRIIVITVQISGHLIVELKYLCLIMANTVSNYWNTSIASGSLPLLHNHHTEAWSAVIQTSCLSKCLVILSGLSSYQHFRKDFIATQPSY